MTIPYTVAVFTVGIVSGIILIPLVLRSIKPIASPYPAADIEKIVLSEELWI